MDDRIAQFWSALGALTFAETIAVAETMRDAHDGTHEFEPTDTQDWSFLLNTARCIYEDRDEEQ